MIDKITIYHPKPIKLKNTVMVTDPCYDMKTWCNIKVNDVLPGTYQIFVRRAKSKEDCYDGVSRLLLVHENYVHYFKNDKEDLISDIDGTNLLKKVELVHRYHQTPIGVDSGLAGFFNYDYFTKIKHSSNEKQTRWYHKVCDKIGNRHYTKIDTQGFISTNWFGDGGYNLFTFVDKADTTKEITVGFLLDYRLEPTDHISDNHLELAG